MAKTIIGVVSSTKGDKTIVVTAHTRMTHPLYRKQYMVTNKFMAHDEKNEAKVGDRVSIAECRPISRRKHFMLNTILETPKLREDSLEATKAEDSAKVARAAKKKKEEATKE